MRRLKWHRKTTFETQACELIYGMCRPHMYLHVFYQPRAETCLLISPLIWKTHVYLLTAYSLSWICLYLFIPKAELYEVLESLIYWSAIKNSSHSILKREKTEMPSCKQISIHWRFYVSWPFFLSKQSNFCVIVGSQED